MPAVSIAIVRDGRLAWQRAFGVKDTATNEPVDVNTSFAACSDTKPVFAYGVLKLCEKGVLNLDTPLTKYTSLRTTADPRIELITARHVLNHTTGFPNWRQGPDLPIEFTPGSKNQYSGEGFSYLQSVVVEITGKSFEDFMHNDILKPLGMTSSPGQLGHGLCQADRQAPRREWQAHRREILHAADRGGKRRRHGALWSGRYADDNSGRLREVSSGVPEPEAGR